MTPAIVAAQKAGVKFNLHGYDHDPASRSYGLEAAEKLGVDPARVFKTLIVEVDRRHLWVAIIPVEQLLNLKRLAAVAGGRKAAMAPAKTVERATGYVLGGVSPLGQKKRMPTALDETAMSLEKVYVSAGKRGLDMTLRPGDLVSMTGATVAALS